MQVVAQDGVHVGDLIRVKVARGLEGLFAERVDDISAAMVAAALQQFKGVLAIFRIRVAEHAPGASRIRTIRLLLIPVWNVN